MTLAAYWPYSYEDSIGFVSIDLLVWEMPPVTMCDVVAFLDDLLTSARSAAAIFCSLAVGSPVILHIPKKASVM